MSEQLGDFYVGLMWAEIRSRRSCLAWAEPALPALPSQKVLDLEKSV
jgi:hypothetical protein